MLNPVTKNEMWASEDPIHGCSLVSLKTHKTWISDKNITINITCSQVKKNNGILKRYSREGDVLSSFLKPYLGSEMDKLAVGEYISHRILGSIH